MYPENRYSMFRRLWFCWCLWSKFNTLRGAAFGESQFTSGRGRSNFPDSIRCELLLVFVSVVGNCCCGWFRWNTHWFIWVTVFLGIEIEMTIPCGPFIDETVFWYILHILQWLYWTSLPCILIKSVFSAPTLLHLTFTVCNKDSEQAQREAVVSNIRINFYDCHRKDKQRQSGGGHHTGCWWWRKH